MKKALQFTASGHEEFYQTLRSSPGLARPAAAALETSSRNCSSSTSAASDAAASSSLGPGRGGGLATECGGGESGSGSRPAAKRSFGGVCSPRTADSCSRTVGSSWPSSNAQEDELVVTCSVPSRAIREGHALRATAGPTASGHAETIRAIPAAGPNRPSSDCTF